MLSDREIDLAWTLADIVGDRVPVGDRHNLYVTLGIGDLAAAIHMLLVCVAEQHIALPAEVFRDARSWSQLYCGTPEQTGLAGLLDRVHLEQGLS